MKIYRKKKSKLSRMDTHKASNNLINILKFSETCLTKPHSKLRMDRLTKYKMVMIVYSSSNVVKRNMNMKRSMKMKMKTIKLIPMMLLMR
jgi:hypothetical protein